MSEVKKNDTIKSKENNIFWNNRVLESNAFSIGKAEDLIQNDKLNIQQFVRILSDMKGGILPIMIESIKEFTPKNIEYLQINDFENYTPIYLDMALNSYSTYIIKGLKLLQSINFVLAKSLSKDVLCFYSEIQNTIKEATATHTDNEMILDLLNQNIFTIEDCRNQILQTFTHFGLTTKNRALVKKITSTENNTHPKHDPNYWNYQCFELFKYLFDNYYKGTQRQITNIWFFLKENNPQQYIKKCTKDEYKVFIKENYSIEITNFDKATQKYEDTEYNSMNEHRQNFENSLK